MTNPSNGATRMSRTYAITGAGSGIGKATADLFTQSGHRVIGIDLRDADITIDLSNPENRNELPDLVAELAPEGLDGILAIAGGPPDVNFFGAIATLDGLRPLLLDSPAPRAVAVTSLALLHEVDDRLVSAYLSGDEVDVAAESERIVETGRSELLYSSSKRALSQWIRRESVKPEWAGNGIPLNAVAPGIIRTPMTFQILENEDSRRSLLETVPMPLNGPADAHVPAQLLAWLAGEANSHVTGQIIFLDGGADVSIRGDAIFA